MEGMGLVWMLLGSAGLLIITLLMLLLIQALRHQGMGEVLARQGRALANQQAANKQLLDERKRSVMLTVLAGAHDPHKRYDLVMRDAVTNIEVLRLPIKVDLAFGNDF